MRRWVVAAVILSLFLTGCSMESFSDSERAGADIEATPLEQSTVPPPHSGLADVVEQTLPSVVNVKVKSISLSEVAPPTEGVGEGSGVVIADEGIILTNYHVVAGAVSVRVVFTDDRDPLEGTVIGGDPDRDLAVIKVEADDLDAIELGNSGQLKLGDGVVAMGFPLGLGGPTVTSGILSGTDRTIEAQAAFGVEELVGLLQTDAAINPGNSGGALVDLNGRLVGINTAVAGSAENIGFAIAIDEALPIVNEILTEPAERHAWLGVQLANITSPAIAQELGVPPDLQGAIVFSIIPGSPAEESDLQEGDVVVAIDGDPITSREDLIARLAEMDPGAEVDLTVVSAAGERSVTVVLAQRPATFEPGDQDEE
ncbi:MAG: trypsin-like peptidase domain-containing protein [Actinomycetota bacterium]|nr:trypsin-like peptidase domain-containing protein [Actinomycetota bacterium]